MQTVLSHGNMLHSSLRRMVRASTLKGIENFGRSGAFSSGGLNSGSDGVCGGFASGAVGGAAEPPKSGSEKLKLGGDAGAAFGVGLLLEPCS